MKIEEIQNKILEIAKEKNKSQNCEITTELSLMRIAEELGNIAGESFNKNTNPQKFNKDNLKKYLCNIILETCLFAKLLNINLSEELNNKIKKISRAKKVGRSLDGQTNNERNLKLKWQT